MFDECLFCRIGAHELGANIVYEDDRLMAFLDTCPIRPGHTQIIPKQHFTDFEGAPPDIISSVVSLGQKLSSVMKGLYGVPRVAFLFTGGDVAHVHAHVVPMHHKTDITSARYIVEQNLTFRSTPRASDADLEQCARDLRAAI